MGLLKIFAKANPAVRLLPSGSMTVDGSGRVLATTIPSSCPAETLDQVAGEILRLFREANAAQIPLGEMTLDFASLRIIAREMRGGAIIFLKPRR